MEQYMNIEFLITKRINMFHDALVARGQIKPLSPQIIAHEDSPNRCRADQLRLSDHPLQLSDHLSPTIDK